MIAGQNRCTIGRLTVAGSGSGAAGLNRHLEGLGWGDGHLEGLGWGHGHLEGLGWGHGHLEGFGVAAA